MHIKYLNNSKEDHVERNLGQSLIRAGLAVAIGDPDADKPGRLPRPGDATREMPQWKVLEFVGTERRFIAIRMTILGRTELYSASPDQLTRRSFSWPCPETVFNEYKAAYRANPALRDTMTGFGSRAADAASDANVLTAHEKHNADQALSDGRLPVSPRR